MLTKGPRSPGSRHRIVSTASRELWLTQHVFVVGGVHGDTFQNSRLLSLLHHVSCGSHSTCLVLAVCKVNTFQNSRLLSLLHHVSCGSHSICLLSAVCMVDTFQNSRLLSLFHLTYSNDGSTSINTIYISSNNSNGNSFDNNSSCGKSNNNTINDYDDNNKNNENNSNNNNYHQNQPEGVAMGNPVSAITNNLFIENFEQQALRSCPPEYVPKILKRYVDDTFIVTTRSTVNNLLLHMNSQQLTIHFTIEVENNNQIVFLDMLVHRDINHHLVYRNRMQKTHPH